VNIDANALSNLDFGNIVKINFKRTSAFPDFIMDWVTNQLEEIINKLTTLPTLYIILPDFSGFADSGWNNFMDKFNKAKDDIKTKNAETDKKNAQELAKADEKANNIQNTDLRAGQKYINAQKDKIK
jgi:hypothetical protein